MKHNKSPKSTQHVDRRSGFNRRWIKSHYSGEERRSGKDRREGLPTKDLSVPDDLDSKKMIGFEKLLVSGTIQLEAITRILLDKGMIQEPELREMIKKIQTEYQSNNQK